MSHLLWCTLLQVWLTALAEEGGASGNVISTIKANAGDAEGKLHIEAVHILGVAALANTQQYVVSAQGKQVPAADVTAVSGVLKVSGLQLSLTEPIDISWTLVAAST